MYYIPVLIFYFNIRAVARIFVEVSQVLKDHIRRYRNVNKATILISAVK